MIAGTAEGKALITSSTAIGCVDLISSALIEEMGLFE